MNSRLEQGVNVLQTLAIVAGLVFGAVQLEQFRNEQHRQSDAQMAQSLLTTDFMEGYTFVQSLPDSVDFPKIQRDYSEHVPSVLLLSQTFETIGIMVHRGDIQLSTVDDFLGSAAIESWRKLEPAITRYRKEEQTSSISEWFQWLAERLQEYRRGIAPAPAYVAYKDWRPEE